MPVLSDFSVITKSDFVFRSSTETKSYGFNTGGRHNSNALLDLALLGGYKSGDENLSVRFRLNGTSLTTSIINRWQSHATIVHDRVSVVIDPGILRSSGVNTLRLEPIWEGSSDYLFVGPLICHFHQRD